MIKLLIADDHSYIADGAELALSSCDDIKVVCKATELDGLEDLIHEHSADVVLLDINFGTRETGLDFARSFIPANPNVGIVFFSQYDDANLLIQVYQMGTTSFVAKNMRKDEIYKAVKAASKGESYYPKEVSDKLLKHSVKLERDMASDPRLILDEQEFDYFLLAAEGKTQKEIAEVKNVTQKTAGVNIGRIIKKLGYKNTNELSILAGKLGLVKVGSANDFF